MPYQAYFGPPVLRGKIFLSLAAEWDLLEIWSGRKYKRTKEIARHPQTTLKKLRISSILLYVVLNSNLRISFRILIELTF